ncbi:MAG: terpene cyclase/mutase family protein [Thermoplasmata archaeon]|nr:terpene cyclase/mutase family protein [Thermoplasmata archaeon]TFG70583.1 MAG: hypothetical protein E4H25_01690 [Methanomassiliicoccus sp.]
MLKQEIDRAVEESARKLYQMSIPPVRRWLLETVMDKDENDPSVQRAIEESQKYPFLARMLAKQRKDGTWPIPTQRKIEEDAGPGPPYGWTYISMVRNLYIAYEYCARSDDPHIQLALERILSWQHKEGYINGPHPDMIPRAHYNGIVLGILHKFGYKNDPRTKKLANWLLKTQRKDGGWNIPYIQDMRYRPEYRFLRNDEFIDLVKAGKTPEYDPLDYMDIPSCIWTTAGVNRGLAWLRPFHANKAAHRGGEFVLDRFFKRNYHSNFYQSGKNWTMLKFPTYAGSGLTVLDSLLYLGFGPDDERMEKPIRWLLGERRKDGFWYRSHRPHPIDDQWLTVSALLVLHLYSSKY